MANYIYSDEDNAPMSRELFDRIDQDGHNPTVYGSHAEMVAVEKDLPFTDPEEPHCCGNCDLYDGEFCTKNWNNMDDGYKIPERDRRLSGETCGEWSGEYGFSLKDS